MIALGDISSGIISVLREYMDIAYISEEALSNANGHEFLHIQLIPLKSATAAAGYFVDRQIFVDIAYMEKLHTSNRRIYEVLDRIDQAFKPFFRIKDRAFTPAAQMDITDDIGHYKMTLEFTDTIPQKEEPLAEHLMITWRK